MGAVVSLRLKSHVYKAFNTVGVEQMAKPDGSLLTGEQLTMLYCGDEGEEPKGIAEDIIRRTGFAPVFAGSIRYARNLEALAELWIHRAYLAGDGVNFHFQVLRPPQIEES